MARDGIEDALIIRGDAMNVKSKYYQSCDIFYKNDIHLKALYRKCDAANRKGVDARSDALAR